MHIRNITACPPFVFKKQLDLHLSPILDCPCTPNFNNSLDNKYYMINCTIVCGVPSCDQTDQEPVKQPEEEEECIIWHTGVSV